MVKSAQSKSVGVWVRVSTEDQAQGESPAHHEKRARLYAEAKGWEVATVYDLSGVSGKSVMEHAETKRMLKDAAAGAITGLIFSKLARLARNTKELLDFAEIFRGHGADLISLQESIDTSSPAGRLFYTMIAAMAQWEREEIAERVAASVPVRAKLGKAVGGQPSFGYHWVEGRLVPHPEEAPVRALIYELFLEHERRKTVARLLNERGYRTRNGGLFSDTTVLRLIRDPTPKGIHRANYTRSTGRGKGWELKAESDWVYREVPAVVSEETWERANAIIAKQASGKKKARKAEHLFAGLVRCECGAKMYVKGPAPKYLCRSCNRKIPADDLEEVFRHELHSFFLSDDDLRAFFEADDADIRHREELVNALETERRRGVSEMDRLYRAFMDDNLPAKSFGELHGGLKARQEQIDDEVIALRAQIDLRKINHLSSEEVIAGARDLYGRWHELSFAEKRSVIEAIVEAIVVGEAIEIHLSYTPDLPEPSETGGGGGSGGPNGEADAVAPAAQGPQRLASAKAADPASLGTGGHSATHSCRCGGGAGQCRRGQRCAAEYQGRLSGPLLDRIDLQLDVPPVTAADLALPPPAEGSADVAARVLAARETQSARGGTNAAVDQATLERIASPDEGGAALLGKAAQALSLSARAYHRTLRVARTIADLDGASGVRRLHVAEALSFRRVWANTAQAQHVTAS